MDREIVEEFISVTMDPKHYNGWWRMSARRLAHSDRKKSRCLTIQWRLLLHFTCNPLDACRSIAPVPPLQLINHPLPLRRRHHTRGSPVLDPAPSFFSARYFHKRFVAFENNTKKPITYLQTLFRSTNAKFGGTRRSDLENEIARDVSQWILKMPTARESYMWTYG